MVFGTTDMHRPLPVEAQTVWFLLCHFCRHSTMQASEAHPTYWLACQFARLVGLLCGHTPRPLDPLDPLEPSNPELQGPKSHVSEQ